MKYSLKTNPIAQSIRYLIKWSLFAFLAGGAGGLFGTIFAKAIKAVTLLRTDHNWILYLLPLIGVLIAFLYRVFHEEKNRGTNMVLTAVSEGDDVTLATGPLIFVSTILSHLGGASVGREGAALQLGGWMGRRFGELLHFNDDDRRIAVMSGMSAVFAALFGTPVAASIFCIEVVRIGVFHYVALIPCVFSAFIGSGLAGFADGRISVCLRGVYTVCTRADLIHRIQHRGIYFSEFYLCFRVHQEHVRIAHDDFVRVGLHVVSPVFVDSFLLDKQVFHCGHECIDGARILRKRGKLLCSAESYFVSYNTLFLNSAC